MSVKVEGNRYCDSCEKPVVATKSTHRVRNASAAAALPLTGGLSIAGFRRDLYVCPDCGGRTSRIWRVPAPLSRRESRLVTVWVGLLAAMAAVVGLHAVGLF